MKTQFSQDSVPIQQKGRRIPVHLQKRVEKEINKLIDQNHIIKLDKCSDQKFISPIVITVRKDQTVKLVALDSKKINKYIHKNKYQMPNIELLLDNIAGGKIGQISANTSLNTRPTLRIFTNPVGQNNQRTMQLQSYWGQRYWNLSISNRVLASRTCQPTFKKQSI